MTRRPRPKRWAPLLAAGLGGFALLRGGWAGGEEPVGPELPPAPLFGVPVSLQDEEKLKPPTPLIGTVPVPQRRPPRAEPRDESFLVVRIKTTPPEPGELFRLESEKDLRQRVMQETRQFVPTYRGQLFPEIPTQVTPVAGVPRLTSPLVETVEPYFVCYGRTYFEQPNYERYGWSFGLFQPLISAGLFYTDLVRLPYDWITEPCRHYECNAGFCLPGDPVPLMWYPCIRK